MCQSVCWQIHLKGFWLGDGLSSHLLTCVLLLNWWMKSDAGCTWFNVLAWLFPALTEECMNGACQPVLIFFPSSSQMCSLCRYKGCNHITQCSSLVCLKMVFDIYFPGDAGFMSRFYWALFPVHSRFIPPSFYCIPVPITCFCNLYVRVQ